MQNFLVWMLLVLLTFGASGRSAFANTEHANASPAKAEGHRDSPSSSEEALTTPPSAASDVGEEPGGQTGSGSQPPPKHHHGHFVRNAIIAFAACFAFALIVAVAAK